MEIIWDRLGFMVEKENPVVSAKQSFNALKLMDVPLTFVPNAKFRINGSERETNHQLTDKVDE